MRNSREKITVVLTSILFLASVCVAAVNVEASPCVRATRIDARMRMYWKANYLDYAPSGMPDFDQKQWGAYNWTNFGTWSHCGPVAAANSLWWYDAVYEINTTPPPAIIDNFNLVTSYNPGGWDDHDPLNAQPFVEHLAHLMDTDGRRTGFLHLGTNVTDMETGVAQYLSWSGANPQGDVDGNGIVDATDSTIVNMALGSIPGTPNWNMAADIWPATTGWPVQGVADNIIDGNDLNLVTTNLNKTGMFYEHTVPTPDFYLIEEEVDRCQDVILILGFYTETGPGEYFREDYPYPYGHAVTVAGVNSTTMQIAISDPVIDGFEIGLAPGRSPVPHIHMPPEPPYITHNNASLVSHDEYNVTFDVVTGMWELKGYAGLPTPPFHILIESAVITSSDMIPPNIGSVSQNPPENNVLPTDEVTVNVTVIDDLSGVKQVILNYTNGNETWIILEMTNLEANIWNASIPAFPFNTNVTYVIMAEDNANNIITTEDMGYEYQYRVIPEFPSFLVLPLFMIATLLAALVYKRKHLAA